MKKWNKAKQTSIKRNPPPTKTQLLLSVWWKFCDGLNAVSSALYKVEHTKWDWSHSFQCPKKCQRTWPSSACSLITSPPFGHKKLVQNCVGLLPSAHSLPCKSWTCKTPLCSLRGSFLLTENNQWEDYLLQFPSDLECTDTWALFLLEEDLVNDSSGGFVHQRVPPVFCSPFIRQKEDRTAGLCITVLSDSNSGSLKAWGFLLPQT